MSFFSRWTKGGKAPSPPPDEPIAPTEAAPTVASSPPEAPPKRTRTEPMMTAVERRPPPAVAPPAPPPPAPAPPKRGREDLNTTKKSGPDVLVSRVVEISEPPPPMPPPVRRPELPAAAFTPGRPVSEPAVDWDDALSTATKPNLGAAAEAARAQLSQSEAEAIPPPPPSRGRPMAPSIDPPARGPFGSDVDGLLDDVDAGFDNILGDDGPRTSRDMSSEPRSPSGGLSDARALFAQLAAGHVRHVRDFMIDVLGGQAKTEWVSVCQPAIRSLLEMSKQLQMNELVEALDGFGSALMIAGAEMKIVVEGDAQRKLIDAYQPLVAAMPLAFTLDEARSAREGIIVQALLQQIPEVRKVQLDKIYAAGLTSLSVFYLAKPEEITVTTGISTDVARKILDRFQRYKQEIEATTVDAARTAEHTRLTDLFKQLREAHTAFERAEAEGDSKAKRDQRKAREDIYLEVKVLLARLGETDRLASMEKLPFSQKVSELQGYLDEVRMRAKAKS